MKHNIFPVFHICKHDKIVVVGGGKIATRRIKTLLQFDFDIVVVAKKCSEELLEISANNSITIVEMNIKETSQDTLMELCMDAYLVLACTDDAKMNRLVVDIARKQGALVNACDNKALCDFYFPGIHTMDQVVIGVAGDGSDHHKTAQVIKQIRDGISYEN